MEIHGIENRAGDDVVPPHQINHRRLMMTWQYRLSVAVNEQLDLTFRLTDPSGNAGQEVFGSGAGSGETSIDLLTPRLANASFTWKPSSNFHFSGGLLDVASNTALDIHASYVRRNPTLNFFNTYGNSLAGIDFSFPVNPTTRLFATAGVANRMFAVNSNLLVTGDNDTIKPYNDGRIIVGANLAFAERKVTMTPVLNIMTTGKTSGNVARTVLIADNETGVVTESVVITRGNDVVSRGATLSQGLDMGFRLASQFNLNANFGALQHNTEDVDSNKISMITFGIEPVVTFGGENNRLFTARVRYAMEVLNNNGEGVKNDESANVHFVDARFGIAVNPRLSITPRVRHWSANHNNWYGRGLARGDISSDKSSRSLTRLEVGFASSF
jgi:hypothetical protein